MELDKAVKELKKYHIEESAEEFGISVDEFKKRDIPLPFKYDALEERYKKINFIPGKKRKAVREAFDIVKKHIPSLDLDSIYILPEKYYLKHSGTFAPAVTDGMEKYSVVLTGSHIKYMSPKTIAGVLLHESIHLDMAENPERYGYKKPSGLFTSKFFGLDEKKVNKKTRQILGTEWEKKKDEARDKAFKDMMEGEAERLFWQPYFRLLTLMEGESYNPKWEAQKLEEEKKGHYEKKLEEM